MSIEIIRKIKSIKKLTNISLIDKYKEVLSDIDYRWDEGFVPDELYKYRDKLKEEILKRMDK